MILILSFICQNELLKRKIAKPYILIPYESKKKREKEKKGKLSRRTHQPHQPLQFLGKFNFQNKKILSFPAILFLKACTHKRVIGLNCGTMLWERKASMGRGRRRRRQVSRDYRVLGFASQTNTSQIYKGHC